MISRWLSTLAVRSKRKGKAKRPWITMLAVVDGLADGDPGRCMIGYDMIRYDIIRYGTIRYDAMQCNAIAAKVAGSI